MTRTATWSKVGKSVEECKDVEQVLKASGLDYTVNMEQVYSFHNGGFYKPIPNRFVTTREDGHTYDVVSDKFEIIQNKDAFDFVNFIGDELTFEKAGETASGLV